jgi:hypothetical protein
MEPARFIPGRNYVIRDESGFGFMQTSISFLKYGKIMRIRLFEEAALVVGCANRARIFNSK